MGFLTVNSGAVSNLAFRPLILQILLTSSVGESILNLHCYWPTGMKDLPVQWRVGRKDAVTGTYSTGKSFIPTAVMVWR